MNTKTDFDRALKKIFEDGQPHGGWDADSIALGFAMARGVQKNEIFDFVHILRGRPVPWRNNLEK